MPIKCQKSENFKIPSYKLQFIMDSVIKSQNMDARTYHDREKLQTDQNLGPNFGYFPIQKAENARKRPIFDASYLGNQRKLREKWAHSETRISRATTYVQTKKIWDFDPDPPLSP